MCVCVCVSLCVLDHFDCRLCGLSAVDLRAGSFSKTAPVLSVETFDQEQSDACLRLDHFKSVLKLV